MEVAMDPHRRPGPARRHDQAIPDGQHALAMDAVAELVEMRVQPFGARIEWDAAYRIVGRLRRCRLMKRVEEPSERRCERLQIIRRQRERRAPGKPGHDRPWPRKPDARTTDANRSRDRKRKFWRQPWQPALLMLDEDGGRLPPWQADSQVGSEAKNRVVPSFTDFNEGQSREIWMLFVQQRSDERLIDMDFSRRH